MEQARVIIQLAVHNGSSWLGDVLDSVAAQSYPAIDVVVWDNASTDGTREMLHRYPGGRLVASDGNIGFWAAMEELYPSSDAPYVICLTDVVLHPDFVSQAVSAMEHDGTIGAVQGKIYEQHRRDDGSWERTDTIDTLGFRLECSRRVTILGHGEQDIGQFSSTMDILGVEGAVPVFRRTALDACRINGFVMDPDYRVGGITYADDFDLGWRMTLMGWRQVMVPEAIGWHDRSTTKDVLQTGQLSHHVQRRLNRRNIPIQKRRLEWSNVRFTLVKNDHTSNIIRDFPAILAREIDVMGYAGLFERPVLLEWGRFLRLLPTMLVRRHAVLAAARVGAADIRNFIVEQRHEETRPTKSEFRWRLLRAIVVSAAVGIFAWILLSLVR